MALTALSVTSFTAGCGGPTVTPAPAPPVTVAAPPPEPAAPPPAPARVVVSIADSIFALTNRERMRADLTPLRRSSQLTRAAQIQAEQMASAKKLAHDIPGAKYSTMAARLRATGYTARTSGENIAEGYTSGAALVAGWMMSPAHRANILSPKFTETGIGTARAKNGRTYHAQLFARPR
ncbi:MAG: Cysteine-rich secretory protein family protein [Gemmatimonadetes bacterium]|nr:Cysteine-rich secretory protein family protein [Gemmatimonadota bacterium]